MTIDYASVHDGIWSAAAHPIEHSFIDVDMLAEEIQLTCAGRRTLDIGTGAGQLVHAQLGRGIDAYGIDVSAAALAHASVTAAPRFCQGSVLALPYEDAAFDTLIATRVLEYLDENDVMPALLEMRRVCARSVYLRISTVADPSGTVLTTQDRRWWEERFFEAGFRKHPSYYSLNNYEALEHDGAEIIIVLERLPDAAAARYPLAALVEERDLHMDMTREPGSRSDAHIARYHWALQFIRPGDSVLDAACGLGYGSYLLQSCSAAKRTLGIDGSEYAYHYAKENFAVSVPGLEFRCGMLPQALLDIPDHSVDVVVSFETLEHIDANVETLAQFHRILTPGGRIVTSVPNDWSDGTGEDPNPFHVHVYTLKRLRQELETHFTMETLVAQTANQYKQGEDRLTWHAAGRSLRTVPMELDPSGTLPPAEWWLAVAMRSPLEGIEVPYHESNYPTFDSPAWHVTRFARDYQNPWLVRAMVDYGTRLKDKAALRKLAETVVEAAPPASADVGAALCVLAYQLLESPGTVLADVERMHRLAQRYVVSEPASPHALRWHVSIWFVLGKLWLAHGQFQAATTAFQRCTEIDAIAFSPLLCNRVVEAYCILGELSIGSGATNTARQYWRAGIELAHRAVQTDWSASLGDIANPAEFGLSELASLLEYANSCAVALANAADIQAKVGWWKHPSRNRVSQLRQMARHVRYSQLGLADAQAQLLRYAEQADLFSQELLSTQQALASSQAEKQVLEDELSAYREQAQEFVRQLKVLQDTAAAREGWFAGQLAELDAYREQAQEFVRQINVFQAISAQREALISEKTTELAAYQKQAHEFAQQMAVAQEQLQGNETKLVKLRNQIAEAELVMSNMQNQIMRYEREREAIAKQEAESLQLMQTIQHHVVSMQANLEQREAELQVARRTAADMMNQFMGNHDIETRLNAENGRLKAQLALMERQQAAVYASTSWRFTRPLRLLGRVLRGGRS